MKKISVFLFTIFFTLTGVFAQKTNDNGSTGGNNDNTKPQNNDNNNNNNTDGLLVQLTKVVFGAYQTVLVNKRGNDTSVFGIEAGITGGLLTSSSGSFIAVDPRFTLNKGALSFDARYDYLKGDYFSQKIDALAEFNIIVKEFKMSIGQGIMYDIDNSLIYHESLLGIDLGINNRQIILSPEFRLAYDWTVHKPVSSEFNLKGSFRLLNFNKTSLYFDAGAGIRYIPKETYANIFGGVFLVF